MQGINRVMLIGVASDVRTRSDGSGRFVITTTEPYTAANGEERTNENTLRVVCDDLPALEDGHTVSVIGTLEANQYKQKDGSEVKIVEVWGQSVARVHKVTPHINEIIWAGNVGADPEMRYLSSGVAVTNVRMVTGSKPRDGQGEDTTVWVNVTIWRKLAEIVHAQVQKGDRLTVQGRVTLRTYTTRDGKTGYSTDVTATEIVMARAAPSAPAQEDAPAPRVPQATAAPAPALVTAGAGDDDLDFFDS